jgi:hypothetical protein
MRRRSCRHVSLNATEWQPDLRHEEQASGEKVGDDRPICGDARRGMVAARNGRADATTTRLMALGPGRFHFLPLLRILTKP